MSATNSTANYGLPIFVSSDVPSWLTDFNGAMGDIDTAIAAAKAVADSALLASGNNTSDITTIQGQITSLQNTVGTHTTQIGTISGNINTINSLIGNGTPTTTDQTLIGAINELHANQGDLTTLTTTDKSSLVAAINEVAQSGGGATVLATVAGDGVKTMPQLLEELLAAADTTEINNGSKIEWEVSGGVKSVYTLSQKDGGTFCFSSCKTDGTAVRVDVIKLTTGSCARVQSSLTSTVTTSATTTALTLGDVITLYK